MGKKRAGVVSEVEVPNGNGTYTKVDIQDKMEAAIQQNNEARFQLTETTTFMQW
jgi:hypothetical protein